MGLGMDWLGRPILFRTREGGEDLARAETILKEGLSLEQVRDPEDILAGTIQLRLEKAIEFGCSRLQGFNCIAVGQGRQFAQNFTPPGTVVFFPDR